MVNHFETIHLGQHQIENHQVHAATRCDLETLFRIGRCQNLVLLSFETKTFQVLNEWIVFDNQDAQFADFQVWQDKNQNGISEADELSSLDDADSGFDIAAINLDLTANTEIVDVAGIDLLNTAEFIRGDGSSSLVGDVGFWFADFKECQ